MKTYNISFTGVIRRNAKCIYCVCSGSSVDPGGIFDELFRRSLGGDMHLPTVDLILFTSRYYIYFTASVVEVPTIFYVFIA